MSVVRQRFVPHRCQPPWNAHPLWPHRYDFFTAQPPRSPSQYRTNRCFKYIASWSGPSIYITEFRWPDASGKDHAISRAELSRGFDLLVTRVDWMRSSIADLETVISSTEEGSDVRTEAQKIHRGLCEHFTVVSHLARTVGAHLDFIADSERNGIVPTQWTHYPYPIDVRELSRIDGDWIDMRLWMYQRGTVTDFAFRVCNLVTRYGIPFGADAETCMEMSRILYARYLESISGQEATPAAVRAPSLDTTAQSARDMPAVDGQGHTRPPPRYVAVPPEMICGLCGAPTD